MNKRIKLAIAGIAALIAISGCLQSQIQVDPPTATLTIVKSDYGINNSQGFGSYCLKERWIASCRDEMGILTLQEPLPVSSPFTSHLSLPFQETPEELQLNVIPVTNEDKLKGGEGHGWQLWRFQEGKRFMLPLQREQDIELSLEPGLYVLKIGTVWKDKGNLSYGFLLEVTTKTMGSVNTSPLSKLPIQTPDNLSEVVNQPTSVSLEQAKEIAALKINKIKAQTKFIEWEELWANPDATVGMPYLVRSVDEKPRYWLVPVILDEKVIGAIEVEMDGQAPRNECMNCLTTPYYNPKNIGNCSSIVTISTSEEAKVIAKNITDKYKDAIISEPIYVYDDTGCCSGEAWMFKVVGKDGKIISRVFATPLYAYERK